MPCVAGKDGDPYDWGAGCMNETVKRNGGQHWAIGYEKEMEGKVESTRGYIYLQWITKLLRIPTATSVRPRSVHGSALVP